MGADPDVQESIHIDLVTETLAFYVHSFATGTGAITFSWDGVAPCPSGFGCKPCSDWACKPPEVPYCDGSNQPTCMDPADAGFNAFVRSQDEAILNFGECNSEICVS